MFYLSSLPFGFCTIWWEPNQNHLDHPPSPIQPVSQQNPGHQAHPNCSLHNLPYPSLPLNPQLHGLPCFSCCTLAIGVTLNIS